MTKLQNLNYDKSQKLKFWQKPKSQIATKLKNSNCDKNSNNDKNQKLKLWQNSKTQIGIKLKNSNCDKT